MYPSAADLYERDAEEEERPASVSQSNYSPSDSHLLCCNQDVCNYEMSQPVFIVRKGGKIYVIIIIWHSLTIVFSNRRSRIVFFIFVDAIRLVYSDDHRRFRLGSYHSYLTDLSGWKTASFRPEKDLRTASKELKENLIKFSRAPTRRGLCQDELPRKEIGSVIARIKLKMRVFSVSFCI